MRYLITLILLTASTTTHLFSEEAWEEHGTQPYCEPCWSSYYFTLSGGISNIWDQTNHTTGATGEIDYEHGYLLSASLGYAFSDWLAVEIEVIRLNGELDKYRINGSSAPSASGRLRVWSYLLNGIIHAPYEFCGLHPFFGGGIGFSHIKLKTSGAYALDVKDSRTVFTVQLLSGITYPWTECFDIDLTYRTIFSTDPRFHNGAGDTVRSEFAAHCFSLALRYFF